MTLFGFNPGGLHKAQMFDRTDFGTDLPTFVTNLPKEVIVVGTVVGNGQGATTAAAASLQTLLSEDPLDLQKDEPYVFCGYKGDEKVFFTQQKKAAVGAGPISLRLRIPKNRKTRNSK